MVFSGFWALTLDFSRQQVTPVVLAELHNLAQQQAVMSQLGDMASGKIVNGTEGRAALHVACRDLTRRKYLVDGVDVAPDIRAARNAIKPFVDKVHNGTLRGSTGHRFTDVVVIGIGGSYLGPEFASHALADQPNQRLKMHFLANVDSHTQGRIFKKIDPERTLFVVVSKSYTTGETLLNAEGAYGLLKQHGLKAKDHVVSVTAKGSPGDDPSNPVLQAFNMFDFFGGRYSVASTVGGVPLSLQYGYDTFARFLKGAHAMDRHALTADPASNIPLNTAPISVWNRNYLGYDSLAVAPYADPLAKFAPHLQQLNMESNGKSVDRHGQPVEHATGYKVFGEPGTNAQHSYFQWLHQGTNVVPVEFIGVAKSAYPGIQAKRGGATNHQTLWSNLMAQADALAIGRDGTKGHDHFPGNRPSSIITMKDLSPESVGALLSLAEHRTVLEAFTWGINPFDQPGVQLGKVLATENNRGFAAANDGAPLPGNLAESTKRYITAVQNGELPR